MTVFGINVEKNKNYKLLKIVHSHIIVMEIRVNIPQISRKWHKTWFYYCTSGHISQNSLSYYREPCLVMLIANYFMTVKKCKPR